MVSKVKTIYIGLYLLSFLFLFIHLNYNVRSFEKSHEVQDITLKLQDKQNKLKELQLNYYSKTNLDNIYNFAVNDLGMIRQAKVSIFANQTVQAR